MAVRRLLGALSYGLKYALDDPPARLTAYMTHVPGTLSTTVTLELAPVVVVKKFPPLNVADAGELQKMYK